MKIHQAMLLGAGGNAPTCEVVTLKWNHQKANLGLAACRVVNILGRQLWPLCVDPNPSQGQLFSTAWDPSRGW